MPGLIDISTARLRAPTPSDVLPGDIASQAILASTQSPQERALSRLRQLMLAPEKTTVTFDVFDTFLLRRCTAPDGVFERAFHHLPIAQTRPGLVESFVQHRILAELRAREKLVRQASTGEVTIEEIYRCFPRNVLDLAEVTVDELAAAELRAEIDLCLVNPEILQLLWEAKTRPLPLRVGFVSDTYWSATQLKQVLAACVPGLTADFIYTSSDHRTCKTATLFQKVMAGEGFDATRAMHIGDNAVADILGAQAFGIDAVHYPQAHDPIQPLCSREALAAQLLRSKRIDFSQRLDQGCHLVRRLALSRVPELAPTERDAAAIFGPIAAGFQYFIQQQIAVIEARAGKPAVIFLGRDGYLQAQLWQASQATPAFYAEINRRVALVANLRQIKALQDVFEVCHAINGASVEAFLKADLPAIRHYFDRQPDGIVDGKTFAADLPGLLTEADIALLSDVMRDQILEHLRRAVPVFDDCTDLIVVDLGYAGTIQRALRGIFDQTGLPHRLHGVYLATVDDNFIDLPAGDSAQGYFDGSVMPPAIKLFLLRNIAVMEQICSAPHGSVRFYAHGDVQREQEIRSPSQLATAGRLQQAIITFARQFDLAAHELQINFGSALQALRDWGAVLLLRLLAFPTLAEQEIYGNLQHDVNLGTYLLFDMIDTGSLERRHSVMAQPEAIRVEAPPMWLGGSMAAISALDSCIYGIGAFGLPTAEILGDQVVKHFEANLIRDGQGLTCPVSCLVTAGGELRLRIPVLGRHTGSILAIPLADFVQRGLVRSMAIQRGKTGGAALSALDIVRLADDQLSGLHCRLDGQHFTAQRPDAHLLLQVPSSPEPVSLVTITVLPLAPENVGPSAEPAIRGAA
jgi:FMN phosphatase YigB (HAD superfamily)